MLPLSEGEKINSLLAKDEDLKEGYLIIVTKQGMCKKTPIAEYRNINKNGKYAIGLNEGDEVVSVEYTSGNDELMVASRGGKIIRFSESTIRPLSRIARGLKTIVLDGEDDRVVGMIVLVPDTKIFTITENGYGKLNDRDDFRVQGRRGKGIKAGKFTDKTGGLVNILQITEEDDVMIISNNGIVLRTNADQISTIGRVSQGVRVMKMREDDSVVCSVVVEKIAEDDEETEDLADGQQTFGELEDYNADSKLNTEEQVEKDDASEEQPLDIDPVE